jgi:PAS domain S-box-containing protein
MRDERKTKKELIAELAHLRRRVEELEERGVEPKRAEWEIVEAVDKYRTLVEYAEDAIVVLQDEKVVYHNPICEKLLCYTVAEARGRSFLEFIASEDRDRVRGYYSLRLRGEPVPEQYEVRMITNSGQSLVLEVKPRVIRYEGQPATMVVMRDITERKRTEGELRRRDAILAALGTTLGRFLKAAPLEGNIHSLLAELGKTAEVSRVYVFENHLDEDGILRTSQRYEWVAPGITPQTDNPDMQNFPWQAGGFERWERTLAKGEIIQGHVRDFPPSEQSVLAPQDIKSILVVPIFDDSRWWGFIGFDDCMSEREWPVSAVEALKITAGTLGAFIQYRRADEALRKTEQTLDAILFASPVGIALFRNGTLGWANNAMCTMLGYEEGSLLGKNAEILYADVEEYQRVGCELYSEIAKKGIGQVQTRWVTKDGKIIHCYLQAKPFDARDPSQGVIAAVMDITTFKEAEERLRLTEAKYKSVVDNIATGVALISPNMEIITLNREMMKWFPNIDPSKRPLCYRSFNNPPKQGVCSYCPTFQTLRDGEVHEAVTETPAGGETRHYRIVSSPLKDPNSKIVAAIEMVEDITERRRAEQELHRYQQELRMLASELLFTEERERRRFAVDLHDSIGQVLAMSKLKLDMLRAAASSTEFARDLDEVREFVGQAIQQTRSLTFELSPAVLYEVGLEAALEDLVEQVQERYGIRMTFIDDQKPKPLSEDVRIYLFRAVRELLVNVVKHARARSARVSAGRYDDHLRIEVADDGIGFEASETDPHAGSRGKFGLFSIKERLQHLGGRFEVVSKLGEGTRVTLVAPLR